MAYNPNVNDGNARYRYQPVQPVQPIQQVPVQPVQPLQPVAAVPVQPVQPVVPLRVDPAADNQQSYYEANGMRVENVQNQFYDKNGNLVEQEEEIVEDRAARRLNVLDRVSQIVYFLAGALMVLLALRFVLRLLGASVENGLVNFVYNLSGLFVVPFNGIFNDQALSNASVVEFSTLIAIGVYALLTYGVLAFLNIVLSPGRETRQVVSSSRRRKF